LEAKKTNKKQQSRQDADDLNRWYESVDSAATPDDVFWEEMERQRLQNRLISGGSSGSSLVSENSVGEFPSSTSRSAASSGGAINTATVMMMPPSTGAAVSSSPGISSKPSAPNRLSAEATLNEYAAFAVPDNWLDDELVWLMSQDGEVDENDSILQDRANLDAQIENWECEVAAAGDGDGSDASWMSSDEPWDRWAASNESDSEAPASDTRVAAVATNEFMLEASGGIFAADPDQDEKRLRQQQEEEAEFKKRLSTITIRSERLERARNSPRASAYFAQEPDGIEGYDRCWVSAIDNVCFKNLKGNLRNYGVQFLDNFGDYEDGRVEDMLEYTVEEIASFKARQVYEATRLPCIASRTSWEIEPIPNFNTGSSSVSLPGSAAAPSSPRVASGYRFNNVGVHVDHISDALRPLAEPSRVTQFKTCLCYYDGQMEVYDYGVAEVDLVFCNSLRTFISVSAAINEMVKTLELTFGLEYQPWLKKRVDGTSSAPEFGSAASVKLRDRVLKEGRVLPNEIIDVSRFMDSMVDVELMDECAKELSNRFVDFKPNKVITVATTGLVIALPIAKYLQVPLVYARKERNVVMADTYKASYSSKTVGKNRELLVSKDHLDEEDRVLVVDDFLSSGSSQEALLRIVAESGATAVGVGVLLEKVYESGRQSLSGFDVPIHSLCRVASLLNGVIQLVEEEGFDRMNQKKKQKASSTRMSQ
jgi:xanthine phosphoribosyltransferase